MGFVLARPLNLVVPPSRVRSTGVRIQESASMMKTHSKRTAELQLQLGNPQSHPTCVLTMAFIFRNQPWKSLYILYFGITTLVLRLPIWVVLSLYKPTRTWSVCWTIYFKAIREYIDTFFCHWIPFTPYLSLRLYLLSNRGMSATRRRRDQGNR